MAKAKAREDRKEDAKKAIVKSFVNTYELIEAKEKSAREELAPIFRKVSIEMYEAVKVNKIWASGRALAKSMNKNNVVIQRYINAGEWLKNKSDEELAKHGMTAYDAKTQLRKMKAITSKTASIAKVKSAKAKAPKTKGVASCNHATIDGVLSVLKDIVRVQKDTQKLAVLKQGLIKVMHEIDAKTITTPKGKALNKVLVK